MSDYSPFLLDDAGPTAITLRRFDASAAGGSLGMGVLTLLALLTLGAGGYALLRRGRQA